MQMHDDDLRQYMVRHPEATFFWRCNGSGMEHADIYDGDILVVDRAVDVKHGDIVVAVYGEEFQLRRYVVEEGQVWLRCEVIGEEDLAPISDFIIWGCVIFSIHNPNERATR